MNPSDFTDEQKKDIEERVEKAKIALRDLRLQPGCFVTPINMGDDTFALKTIAYLQDTRYTSPVQQKDLQK